MSQTTGPQPAEQPEQPEPPKAAGRGRVARLVREGRTRWIALGLVAAAGTGGAVALAATVHDHREHARAGFSAMVREHHRFGDWQPKGAPHAEPKRHRTGEASPFGDPGRGRAAGPGHRTGPAAKAPLPLPALPAAEALEKATAAVKDAKAEALRVVPQQGGGSAWLVVLRDTTGVRHAVTVAGDGTITGNETRG
ncbi:hypothetical protein ACIO7M_08265 [Streptomyces toxytricini]|uniref:PepSY domain-containing protein n=1 Tax=Streptomyces toxytricini TaxID=67369 RepID=A0ABW8ECY3_STRT5